MLDLPFSVESIRINAIANAYGERAEIYGQFCGDTQTAVIAVCGGCTAVTFPGYDADELSSFFSFLGKEVFCNTETAEEIKAEYKEYPVLEFFGEFLNDESEEVKLSELYLLMNEGADGDISLPPFEHWYPDFCTRYNHAAAEYAVSGGAAAISGFMTVEGALVTGVSVPKGMRGKGLGKHTLLCLLSRIKKRYPKASIFAVADKANVPFYEKSGFKTVSYIAVCKFE